MELNNLQERHGTQGKNNGNLIEKCEKI